MEEAEEGELHSQDSRSHSHSHTSSDTLPVPQTTQSKQQPNVSPGVVQESAARSTREPELAMDEDDEAAAERERQESEARKRRRAGILTKHNNTTAPQARPAAPVAVEQNAAEPAAAAPSTTTTTLYSSSTITLIDQPAATVVSASNPATATATAPVPVSATSIASEYDMFADSPSLLMPRQQAAAASNAALGSEVVSSGASELLDSWDDAEGYYKYRLGDVLTDSSSRKQYRVCGLQGGGVFSTVLRVKPEGAAAAGEDDVGELVVKVIRNNETMYKAGVKELEFLTRIANTTTTAAATGASPSTPAPRRHIVALLHHFHHRSHLCLVFPPYAMDLRKVIKKFGQPA